MGGRVYVIESYSGERQATLRELGWECDYRCHLREQLESAHQGKRGSGLTKRIVVIAVVILRSIVYCT